jgi:hypothetical protein
VRVSCKKTDGSKVLNAYADIEKTYTKPMECDKCITAVYITIDINAVNNVMFNLLTL